jgi:hypothetical protein
MALQDIVSCAPFRLSQARDLTEYEWGCVHTAMVSGGSKAVSGSSTTISIYNPLAVQAVASETYGLVAAVRANPCVNWKQSWFGPAPAVDTSWFEAVATWYFGLNTVSKANAIRDISTGLLCSQSKPWVPFYPQSIFKGPDGQPLPLGPGEYSFQQSSFAPDSECAATRSRTCYLPMTGRKLLDMAKMLGGMGGPQIPAEWLQMAQYAPPMFLDREVVIGFQLKSSNMGDLIATIAPVLTGYQPGQPLNPMAFTALFEEAAVIWAPGKGASILGLFKNGVDPAALVALLTQMAPDMIGQWTSLIPPEIMQQLPQIMQQWGPQIQQIMGMASQMLPGLLGPGQPGGQ